MVFGLARKGGSSESCGTHEEGTGTERKVRDEEVEKKYKRGKKDRPSQAEVEL